MKKVSLLLVVAVLAAVMVPGLFANGQDDAADDQLELVFVTPLVAHPVWDVAKAGSPDPQVSRRM